MKRLLTILCLLIPFLGVKAGTLKGKIIDQDAQPVAGAVITYYSYSDNSILATTTSDVNGNWELSYEEAWNDIQIVARAEGYTSYTLHDCNVSMNHTWPKIIFRLLNAIDYKAGKRSTIYLPEAPDASWGRFYRLDHEDGNKVVFEREDTPKAYVPYVFFPYQDLHIDISKMDLSDHHDQVRLEHISFSSAINYSEGLPDPESLVTQPMDETLPYAKYSEEGAIEDYLSPAPMHAILSWMWYDFFEGNEEDGTWQAVSPEFIFHDPEPTTYHPFVEACKSWYIVMSNQEEEPSDTRIIIDNFDCKEIEVDGKKYLPMYSRESWNYECEARRVGLFREEGQKVFSRSSETEEETMLYDFSLEVGETYHHPFYGDFKVTKVGDIVVNNEHLKTISFNGSEEPDWIEGIGSLNSIIWEPAVLPGMFFEKIAYVNYSDGDVEWGTIYEHDYKYGDEGVRFPEHYYYLPLSFTLYTLEGHWRGQPLETIVPKDVYEQYEWKQQQENLNYEMVYNVESNTYELHVSGFMVLNCGPNHYIYCIDEQTADSNTHRLTLQHEDVPPLMDCEGGHKVDFIIPGFNKDCTYTVVDERGEHPVAVRDAAYRPFIEEGKVWVVAMNLGRKEVFYTQTFELKGDTLINGHVCKKMMVEEKPYFQNDEFKPMNGYLMALYEENRKVYFCQDGTTDFKLLYDFGAQEGESVVVNYANIPFYGNHSSQYHFIMGKRDETKEPPVLTLYDQDEVNYMSKTFGVEKPYDSYPVQWIEGVGHNTSPLMNGGAINLGWYGKMIDCHVGDRYLRYNKDAIDWIQQLTEPEEATYHHFVEPGKRWCVHGFSMGGDHTVTDYSFSDALEYISHDGHEYFKLVAWSDNKLTEVGELREEKQRVYLYDTEAGKEYLIYDFSLDVGDTFYESRSNRTLTVDSIGQMIVNGDTLKRLYLNDDDGMFTADWVEGIGSLNGPLRNIIDDAPNSWSYQLAYVSGSSYWPFTFGLPFNGWWGTNIVKKRELPYDPDIVKEDCKDTLTYEMIPDLEHDSYALHVTGSMWMQCGPNNYIYCVSEPTDDINTIKLTLRKEGVEPQLKGIGLYEVDFRFPYFQKEMTYHITDDLGEHPVAVRGTFYRPFIEEGKVWKVGWFPGGGNTAQKLDYYYFDGDSITIGGKVCLKMRCRHEANEQWGNPEPWSEYVGAFYEEGRKVFCVFPDKQDFELLYDFESNIGDTIQVYGGVGADQYPTVSCIISKREYINDELFKGGVTYVDVEEPEWDNETQTFINKYNHDDPNRWLEGVGSGTPFANIMFSGWDGFYDDLMSCTVGDEILYYNPYLIDGVTPPDGAEVKRQWLDFTHIKKPRPRAPRKDRRGMIDDEGGDAETLTGEYSIKDLFVNFKPLSGAYTITVTDANDEEVYHKEVQTDNVIALNTALSTYTPGTYTLTVENAEEAYTATFILDDETAVRDLPSDAMVNSKSVNAKCYDLSGRQIPHSSFLKGQASKLERVTRHLPKGIYIRDGKKVVVR